MLRLSYSVLFAVHQGYVDCVVLFSVCFFCILCLVLLFVLFRLLVPVQVFNWKDTSAK